VECRKKEMEDKRRKGEEKRRQERWREEDS
jgi:hypothetical protein